MSSASKHKKETDFATHKRAMNAIAQGYMTNSKRPESHVKYVYPTHLVKGLGCHVWDESGKKYIDFITGLGTNLFGYANETLIGVAVDAIRQGNLLSFEHPQTVKTAERLKDLFPFVDSWKFLKTGGEACSAAIKIARAATNRELVLSEAYHGWHDSFVSLTPPAVGVPPQPSIKPLNLNAIDETVAGVIIEPIVTDWGSDRKRELLRIKDRCKEVGALYIADEVITGFRFPKYSASRYFGVEPDLIVIGKAMSNGFPLAAVGGKYATMNCAEYFVSSTYGGCIDAFAVCEKICDLLEKDSRYKLDDLWKAGAYFLESFNSFCPEKISIEGYPTRGVFKGDPEFKAKFFQEACYAGILFGPSWFFNFPLMEHASSVLETCKDIIYQIQSGKVELKGEMPKSPFAQKVREQK